ncbi:MAG: VanZ family protein [Magnetococcales bacterium]|nr:VanZ family protein [Magnetococcales bacterium]
METPIPSRWRPWLPVVFYTALVYATLPLTPWIFAKLDRLLGHAEVDRMFNIGLSALVGGVIYLLWHQSWRQRLAIVLPVGAVGAVALMMEKASERGHIPIYAVLGLLVCRAFSRVRREPLHPVLAWLWPTLITAALGVTDELIQRVLPNRYFDWKDIAVNAMSGALGVWLWRVFFPTPRLSGQPSN